MKVRALGALSLALSASLSVTACASNNDDSTTITVSAAASLTDAFTEIGRAFSATNPDIDVRFNFAGSSTLAEQINAGAPVDVFASASPSAMQSAVDAGSVGNTVAFAQNSLEIVVPVGNPAAIRNLSDLTAANVTFLVCNAPVPCGAAASMLFERNSLTMAPSSLEPDVRAVLTKIIADEADAGIVYRTDVLAASDRVESILIPDEQNVTNEYSIANTARAPKAAQAFVDFVLGETGQDILGSWGFTTP